MPTRQTDDVAKCSPACSAAANALGPHPDMQRPAGSLATAAQQRTRVDPARVLIQAKGGIDSARDWAALVDLRLHSNTAMYSAMLGHRQASVLLHWKAALDGHAGVTCVQLIALQQTLAIASLMR
jgi:hypothetical protein